MCVKINLRRDLTEDLGQGGNYNSGARWKNHKYFGFIFFFFVISFAILKSISVNYTENDHDRTIPDISVITLLPLSMLNKHYN